MAVTVKFYNSFATKSMGGQIDLDTDSFKVLLVTSTYTFDPDAHDARDDVTNEVTGTNYTAGGIALTSESWTQDNANNRTIFDFDNPVFTNVTVTARGAIIYKDSGAAATDWLVLNWDFGADQSVSGANFELQLDAVGAFVVRQEPPL